ncbi:MAG TPA: VWA domain-containing protein [Pirellulales bacterium]|nr:VWA domain-containing protein [Pirellulales bacterium]
MLHPLLLWFLPLAAVPLLLHLITLYRLRTVELSTFRFLMDSYVQQRRRMKLLEWLLMLLRTGFVALIVLVVARPITEKYGFLFGGTSGRDVVLIVDASPTTNLQTAGSSALKRGKEAAAVVVRKLAPADYVTLIRAGAQPELLHRGYLTDSREVLDKIDTIKPDIAPADLAAALTEGLGTAAHGSRVVYLVSDLERRTWQPLVDHPAVREIGHDVQLVVLNVGSAERPANLALLGDAPRSQRPIVDLPVLLTAKVAASHRDQLVATRVSVVLDDQVVGQLNLTVEPDRPATASLAITPKKAGPLRGRFELPGDDFPLDNTYLFCLNVEPQIRVLLITQQGDTPLEDPAIYLRAALASPLLAKGQEGKQEQQIARSLAVTAIRSDQFNESHLDKTDVIITADMVLDDGRGNLLKKHLERGGGLLMFAGPHVDPGRYQNGLFNATAPRGTNVPRLKYEGPVGNPDDESTFQTIGPVEADHPALSQFERGDIDYFGLARLYRYLPLTLANPQSAVAAKPGDAKDKKIDKKANKNPKGKRGNSPTVKTGPVRTLLKAASGAPVMVETSLGAGRMLVCSFAATPGWSNLPTRALFVPLLLRSIAHLRPAAVVESVAAVRAHEPAPIRLAQSWQGARVEATTPDGHVHPVELHAADERLVGALVDTDTRGYYSFTAQPPSNLTAQTPQTLGFAVNLDVDSADFASFGQERVTQIFTPNPVTYLTGNPSDPVLSAQLDQRHEIWRWLIWGMFAVIGLEFFLATLHSADNETADGRWHSLRLWRRSPPPARTTGRLSTLSEPMSKV